VVLWALFISNPVFQSLVESLMVEKDSPIF